MNKLSTAVLGLAVAALPVLAASPAFAQDERDCNRAQREVTRVELRLATAVTEERNAEVAARNTAREARNAAQRALDTALGTTPRPDNVDELRGLLRDAEAVLVRRQGELDTDSRRLVDLRADLTAAVEVRDEACDEDPAPTTPPTTTPAPTTPPAADDVDCDEVTDARAQEILDADKSDPNDLDDDNDGIACEEELEVNPKPVFVPSGGVNTGGWRK